MPLTGLLLALAAPSSAAWMLSADGLGPFRIGMTEPAVARMIKGHIEDDRESTANYRACHDSLPQRLPYVSFLFEKGRLSRITIAKRRDIRTSDGVGVGSSERRLRQIYKGRLTIRPADYGGPGHSILVWERPGKRGVRYLTDAKGQVRLIYAGASSIQYIEGCL